VLTLMRIETTQQLTTLSGRAGVTPLGVAEFAAHAPDNHWVALASDGTLAGRCSLWWADAPCLVGERSGIVGHFAASDAETAALLLEHACRVLVAHGCTMAVGPMDGTTWRRYRFVTRRGLEPPFFLEPDNPDAYPVWFEQAGFTPLARYFSNLDSDLRWEVSDAMREQQAKQGIGVRQLDPNDFVGELEKIYTLSKTSFSHNFLYSQISRDEFISMYAQFQPAIQPELVLFAEDRHEPVGFVFAVGDLLNTRPGEKNETVIIKSLAVLPEWSGKGVGSFLMALATVNARRLGYKRAIHALMHEENRSRAMSGHYGTVIREYTLYSRKLA